MVNRRNFINGLLAASAGFFILPGAGRLWVPQREMAPVRFVRSEFGQFIFHQEPLFCDLIYDQTFNGHWTHRMELLEQDYHAGLNR